MDAADAKVQAMIDLLRAVSTIYKHTKQSPILYTEMRSLLVCVANSSGGAIGAAFRALLAGISPSEEMKMLRSLPRGAFHTAFSEPWFAELVQLWTTLQESYEREAAPKVYFLESITSGGVVDIEVESLLSKSLTLQLDWEEITYRGLYNKILNASDFEVSAMTVSKWMAAGCDALAGPAVPDINEAKVAKSFAKEQYRLKKVQQDAIAKERRTVRRGKSWVRLPPRDYVPLSGSSTVARSIILRNKAAKKLEILKKAKKVSARGKFGYTAPELELRQKLKVAAGKITRLAHQKAKSAAASAW
jgi:hypothetical protein